VFMPKVTAIMRVNRTVRIFNSVTKLLATILKPGPK
jgi:hypothetical protein